MEKWTGRDGEYFEARLCGSSEALGFYHGYLAKIGADNIFPVAVLDYVWVPPRLRRQGIGAATVQKFIDEARSAGTKLAVLRGKWDGGESRLWARDNLVRWYEKIGWTLFEYDPGVVVPVMYRKL